MSKTPSLTVQLMHATARIAALEAELAATKSIAPILLATEKIATNVYVRRYYDRDGQLWERTTTYHGQAARSVARPI